MRRWHAWPGFKEHFLPLLPRLLGPAFLDGGLVACDDILECLVAGEDALCSCLGLLPDFGWDADWDGWIEAAHEGMGIAVLAQVVQIGQIVHGHAVRKGRETPVQSSGRKSAMLID